MARPSGRKTSQFQLQNTRPQTQTPAVENNFTQGFKTEYTGLNFPENACTATSNCLFTRVGNVTRRNGIDFESNFIYSQLGNRTNAAITTFLWENAGGDGNTVYFVAQVGGTIYFWKSSAATTNTPLSQQQSASTVTLSTFAVTTLDTTQECQYTAGNGYLFIFHPNCDPIYCTNNAGTITANGIQIQIRDFVGVIDGLSVNTRPPTLSVEHQYNLQNQGWTSGSPWSGQFVSVNNPLNGENINVSTGSQVFTLTSNNTGTISNGDIINFSTGTIAVYTSGGGTLLGTSSGLIGSGSVTAYTSGASITLTVSSISLPGFASGSTYFLSSGGGGASAFTLSFTKVNTGFINTWFTAEANYPANSDIWYLFKDSTGAFNPGTTQPNVALTLGQAPQGHYVIGAFNQTRSSISGLAVTNISTLKRPTNGAFHEGRIWFTGVNDTQIATGDAFQYTWTENIYFSQIITDTVEFGLCYQNNDPTSQLLNALLPTDGGVIHIQGCGSIYKLFSVQNGLLVFAANGIWFITGSQGIGFSATDFSITKISGEHSIASDSFVDVKGYPMFWNADAIYYVAPGQAFQAGQKSLEVKNLTLETIKQFYQAIPLSSKKKARGSYNHITGEIRWLYLSTESTGTLNTYSFDSVLSLLTYTGAFYSWSLPSGSNPFVHGITYIEGPGGLNVALPQFKYFTSNLISSVYNYTFAEERDNVNWVDFHSAVSVPYTSSFTTGFRLKGGGALHKQQPQYIHMYSEIPRFGYVIQSVWDYAGTINSNRFSTRQVINNNKPQFNRVIKKHRLRGSGYVNQFQVTSIAGLPFNIAGWSVMDLIGAE